MVLRSLLIILTGLYFQRPSFRDTVAIYRMDAWACFPTTQWAEKLDRELASHGYSGRRNDGHYTLFLCFLYGLEIS